MPVRFVPVLVLLIGFAWPATAHAGRVEGPAKMVRTVQGFHVLTLKMRFTQGQPAMVSVQGDGDTPLSLVILDSQGRRVAGDMRSGDRFVLRWTAVTGEPYQIKVYNRGGVPNRFRLTTN